MDTDRLRTDRLRTDKRAMRVGTGPFGRVAVGTLCRERWCEASQWCEGTGHMPTTRANGVRGRGICLRREPMGALDAV
eukprot:3194247-Pyramimonas_sp.AAC.2